MCMLVCLINPLGFFHSCWGFYSLLWLDNFKLPVFKPAGSNLLLNSFSKLSPELSCFPVLIFLFDSLLYFMFLLIFSFCLCIFCVISLNYQCSITHWALVGNWFELLIRYFINLHLTPGWYGSVGASSGTPKGHRFNSQSGHIPKLQVPSLVEKPTQGNQSMFLSHISLSLSLFLPLPLFYK